MEIVCLHSKASAAVTSQFSHPTSKTKQRFTAPHHFLLSVTRPTATHPPLKIDLLPQPSYKNTDPTISSPQKERAFSICTNHNTSLDVLRLMDGLGFVVSPDIYASLVTECTRNKSPVQAAGLFAHMKRNRRMVGYLNRPSGLLLLNRILMMLVVCGCLDIAHQLFEEMPQRDSICLAIMILGFVDNQLYDRALDLFIEMHQCFVYQKSDVALRVVLVCVLEGCVHLRYIRLGKVVHGWLVKMGYGKELFVGSALVRFYGRFRCLVEANSLFFGQIRFTNHCDYALWTGAIVDNCRGGCFEEVIKIFGEMGRVGVKKNEHTFSSVLKACGRVSDDGSYGKQVHANAIKLALDTHDLVIFGLVDMYGRCGLVNDARKVFDMVDEDKRNITCWNAMVTGFIHNGLCIEAIKLLYQMKAAGRQPQESLIDEVRVACGSEKCTMSIGKDNAEPG